MIDPWRLLNTFGVFEFFKAGLKCSKCLPQRAAQDVNTPLPITLGAGINSLPDEILLGIFEQFESGRQKDFSHVSRTCLRFYRLSKPYLYRHMVIKRCRAITIEKALRKGVWQSSHLREASLDIFSWVYNPIQQEYSFAAVLGRCAQLETLELRCSDWCGLGWHPEAWGAKIIFPKSLLNSIAALPNLKVLKLTGGHVSPSDLPILPTLEHLFLSHDPGRKWWKSWSRNKNLKCVTVKSIDTNGMFQCFAQGDRRFESVLIDFSPAVIRHVSVILGEDLERQHTPFTFNLRQELSYEDEVTVLRYILNIFILILKAAGGPYVTINITIPRRFQSLPFHTKEQEKEIFESLLPLSKIAETKAEEAKYYSGPYTDHFIWINPLQSSRVVALPRIWLQEVISRRFVDGIERRTGAKVDFNLSLLDDQKC